MGTYNSRTNRAARRRTRVVDALMSLVKLPDHRQTVSLLSRVSGPQRMGTWMMSHLRRWTGLISDKAAKAYDRLETLENYRDDCMAAVRTNEFRVAGNRQHPLYRDFEAAKSRVYATRSYVDRLEAVHEILMDEMKTRLDTVQAIKEAAQKRAEEKAKSDALILEKAKAKLAELKAEAEAKNAEALKIIRRSKAKAKKRGHKVPTARNQRTYKGLQALAQVAEMVMTSEVITKAKALELTGSTEALAKVPVHLDGGRVITTKKHGAVTRYVLQSPKA